MNLEEEYSRFIEFGQLLDRKMRRYLVEYIKYKLDPDQNWDVETLNNQYFQYFKRALEEVFELDGLLRLCQKHERVSGQIVRDTLQWLRKSFENTQRKHPELDEEKSRLENWGITPMHVFLQRWSVLTIYLKQIYREEELDVSFYETKFKKLFRDKKNLEALSAKEKDEAELLLTDLLAQWDALLSAKILEFELAKLEEDKQQFTELMQSKVEEFEQLEKVVEPFSSYVGRYWDMSRSLWQETSFDALKHYDELLKDKDSLRELADMLGQMREAEIEIEEEEYEKTIVRKEWVSDTTLRTEINGIQESNDLNRLLSSEAALLGNDTTESLFLKRYADERLLSLQYEDKRLVESEDNIIEVERRIKRKEQGPFIICVDTSESMNGKPEQIAKVLCLGILKMAARENRRAYLINFSTGIETIDLYNIADSIDDLAQFLSMSFHGGTDISLPLYEALRQLESQNYEDADVLVISDFIMYRIEKEVLQRVKYFQQNQGTHFHSLTLSNEANQRILSHFDTNWLYDPAEKGIVKELRKELEDLR